MPDYQMKPSPTFSIPSIIALIAAIFSFTVESAGGILLLAILAIVSGTIGVLMSILPNRRGGIVSVFAIGVGAIGIIVAVFRILHNILR